MCAPKQRCVQHYPRYNPRVNPSEYVVRLLSTGPICDHCLGQQFARLGHGLTGEERGRVARALALPSLRGKAVGTSPCWVCGDVFAQVPDWAEKAAELAAGYELGSFLFGVRLSPQLEATQEFLAERLRSPWAEPVRRELNRSLGRAFEQALRRQNRSATVDFSHPDVRFTVDLLQGSLDMQVSPLYFQGRYRKLIRGIPQTHWPCRKCKGRGCLACGGSGKQYPESVEELVVPAFVATCQGTEGKLHGAGREDVDARMLGRGRPFIVEVAEPRRRTVDLDDVASKIARSAEGKVEVLCLAPTGAQAVAQLKGEHADKLYRVKVDFSSPITSQDLQGALRTLARPIEQRTPRRVRHRRADLIRSRPVYSAEGELLSPTAARIELRCAGGLYVKELISGDQGATDPSLAKLLGVEAQVRELDVLDVLDRQTERQG